MTAIVAVSDGPTAWLAIDSLTSYGCRSAHDQNKRPVIKDWGSVGQYRLACAASGTAALNDALRTWELPDRPRLVDGELLALVLGASLRDHLYALPHWRALEADDGPGQVAGSVVMALSGSSTEHRAATVAVVDSAFHPIVAEDGRGYAGCAGDAAMAATLAYRYGRPDAGWAEALTVGFETAATLDAHVGEPRIVEVGR